MSTIERMTITMPAEMAAVVKGAVEGGDHASTSEALRDWKSKRAIALHELEALKADIDRGLADITVGRVRAFDADRIIERGKKLSATRSPSG